MTVLVDTSVWVDHFRNRNDGLIQLLERDRALIHPMILAEIACGTPPAPRSRTLGDLSLLPRSGRWISDWIRWPNVLMQITSRFTDRP